MNKLLTMALGVLTVSAIGVSNVQATTYDYGQMSINTQVRNVTDNQATFAESANADLCEVVEFQVRIHNAGPQTLKNVKVKATLDTNSVSTVHTSTATVTADNNRENATQTNSATVNLSKAGKLSYVNGSAKLVGSDTVVDAGQLFGAGFNIGDIAVSLNNIKYVQYQAKFNCEVPEVKNITVCVLATKELKTINEKDFDATKHSKDLADCAAKPPVEGEIVVCEMSTKKIVTIKESAFDSKVHTKDLTKCAAAPVVVTQTPTELPRTGATSVLALVASVIAAAAGYVVTARKNLLG